MNLDIEWLYLAATLIHWKSRALLPRTEDTQAAADPVRDELVQLLLAHKRQAAGDLEQRRANEERRFSRTVGGGSDEELRDGADLDRVVTVWDLIQQAREIANSASKYREGRLQAREVFELDPDDVTVAEMIGDLQARLTTQQGVIEGTELLESQTNVSRRSCLFLGMLEMARERLIEIEQRETFGPIWLRMPEC